MAVHLINQQYQASNAMTLMAEGDTVILTNDEIALEVLATLADRKVTVALLTRTSSKASDNSCREACEVISEDDWVRYTTSDESVISWG
jgi:DeoR/GlpR family transcriptional regulator of sugar metabolism